MLNQILLKLKSINYQSYLENFSLNDLDGIKTSAVIIKEDKKWEMINPDNVVPSPPEFDDLIRIHYLILLLKSRVVLEFGVGKSTSVILDAININQKNHHEYVAKNLRITDPFNLYSIDNSQYWLDKVKLDLGHYKNWHPRYSNCIMGDFGGRICTYYENLPNIKPDFIYLDAPSQFGVNGAIRGISTNSPERMPMSADLLSIEYFLEPGTLILVDGRAANARFLINNFQRDWEYEYVAEYDQHFFYLNEPPLGIWNDAVLKFTKLPNE